MLPRSIKTLYAVIGLPPSPAGFVHLTLIDVASMSTVKIGEPGASEGKQNRSAEMHAWYRGNSGSVACLLVRIRDPFR